MVFPSYELVLVQPVIILIEMISNRDNVERKARLLQVTTTLKFHQILENKHSGDYEPNFSSNWQPSHLHFVIDDV